MEDDDDFGDLYGDVLPPLTAPQTHHPSPVPSHLNHPIDLTIKSGVKQDFFVAPYQNSTILQRTSDKPLSYDPNAALADSKHSDSIHGHRRNEDLAPGIRVVMSEDARLPDRSSTGLPDRSSKEANDINNYVSGGDDVKDVKFDIEEADTQFDDGPIIPGLLGAGNAVESINWLEANEESKDKFKSFQMKNENVIGGGEEAEGEGEGDDWDSDSEDDLQIVLNDNSHHGPMGMDRGLTGGDGEEDVDEVGNDGDPNTIDEQDWGDDASQLADGERKEAGEAGKASGGGAAVAPKIGYSIHGYHPFHSQFKYVRPGAAITLTATTAGLGGGPGQVRPIVSMGPVTGRGRGDWRPQGMKTASPVQKGFHPGYGAPWGNNMSGRGFGGGLDFTIPSHKTIFEVDIDGFEEKPWRYPGIDMTDFFNFGLNEESWKDYCKLLEQLRLETTMQSKIRVYESGRTEQDYDPDLPPELAAATGIQDNRSDNPNFGKSGAGQGDLTNGPLRPPLPTGRPIQVETGCGERLPSIDTRPPRIRDLDAIIEIVLEDSVDDDSSTLDRIGNDLPTEGLGGDNVPNNKNRLVHSEYFGDLPDTYSNGKMEQGGRTPIKNSAKHNLPLGDGILPFPPERPTQYHSGSRGENPVYPRGHSGTDHENRRAQGGELDCSSGQTPSHSGQDEKLSVDKEEDSIESMDGKGSPPCSSPMEVRDARKSSFEHTNIVPDADESSLLEKEDIPDVRDRTLAHSMKEKRTSQVEKLALQEDDDDDESKPARSSDNRKARSGSSRDYQKGKGHMEEEVIQDTHSERAGSSKKHLDENEQNHHRKDRDGRQEVVKNRMTVKSREDSYPYTDFHPSLVHHSYKKTDGFERRKESEIRDEAWLLRNGGPYGRKSRPEDSRKRDRGDEVVSRHRGKIHENERGDKDEHLLSRKQFENGSYRIHYDKDTGPRHRERDDNLKSRYEVDDYYGKRRKDEEYLRREHTDKEDILHGSREPISHHKRDRDKFDMLDQQKRDDQQRVRDKFDMLDQQKRDDQQRVRDKFDDHHSDRHKGEVWFQRERGDRQREREEWHSVKQSHEGVLPKREREDRVVMRSGRGSEDRGLSSHSRPKDEYKGSEKDYHDKDMIRHSEQLKRRDRFDDGNSSHYRGRDGVVARANQLGNDKRESRPERSNTRNDRVVDAYDNQRVQEKKRKENVKKIKESEGEDVNPLAMFKRNQEDQSGHVNEMGSKGTGGLGNGKNETRMQHNSSRKHRDDPSSDDEQQDSRRGRSKMERWTSHKERDFSINSKLPSASSKFKEVDRDNHGGSSEASKPPIETAKDHDSVENQYPSSEEQVTGDPDIKDAEARPLENRHLDTVEKLKKRSERFKLPMPSEKDTLSVKKMETEPLPSSTSETPADTTEIKHERPARKRRWISN